MTRWRGSRNQDDLLALVIGVVVIAALYFAKVVLVPIALAILLAFILTPIVQFIERARLGRLVSTLVVVVFSVAAFGVVGWIGTKQFLGIMDELPNYRANINEKITSLQGAQKQTLGNASNTIDEIRRELVSPAGTVASDPAKRAGSKPVQTRPLPVEVVKPPALPLESLQNTLGLLTSAGLAIVFTVFMIVRREDLRNRFMSLVSVGHLNVMTRALDDAGNRVSRYLRLQLVVNVCYGLTIGTGLHAIGLPDALFWGVLGAVLRFVPYLGPPLGAIGPLALSLAIFPGWNRPLLTLGLFLIVELIVSHLIEPFLYGEHTGLSPVAILVAAVFWTSLWGPIGLLLSTPLTVCLVVLGRHLPRLAFLQTLLGDKPALAPDTHFYQRLLAMDHQEAKEVLEVNLKEKSLEDLYDSVLIPALSLAGQDLHRNELDEGTERFICQSTRELIEELRETGDQEGLPAVDAPDDKASLGTFRGPIALPVTLVCVPARDEADELVGMMLAQLLERAGYRAQVIPIATSAEMLAEILQSKASMVCLSALPPFSVTQAGFLYSKLRRQLPSITIVVGLWNFSGDLKLAARRMGVTGEDTICTLLSQVLARFHASSEAGIPVAGSADYANS